MKIINYLFTILTLTILTTAQPLQAAFDLDNSFIKELGDEGIEQFAELTAKLSKGSLDDPHFYYYIEHISQDGYDLYLTDGSSYKIGWWYHSKTKKWQKGDRVKISIYSEPYNPYKIENIDTGSSVWASMESVSESLITVKKITYHESEPDGYSKLYLSNNLVFKGQEKETVYNKVLWKSNQRVMIFHDKNMRYEIFNFDAKEFLGPLTLIENQQEIDIDLDETILTLEERLNKKVLQQREATNSVTLALFNYVAGLKPKESPIGVFLFLGPTGVGKTELAKVLTNELYGGSSHLIRFDMSHFTSECDITRLIGSPPGYVNHEEGGQLTEAIRKTPQAVVLLDEMEKAHPQIHKFFLPVFDEAIILDANNDAVDCNRIIFIMTSNLAGPKIAELFNLGYDIDQILEIIEPELMKALSPELYNRVTPVLFRPLAKETMPTLVDLLIKDVLANLKQEKNITLKLDQSSIDYLVENGFHPLLGARPLKKLIDKKVIGTVAYAIVKNEIIPGDTATFYYSEEEDIFYFIIE